MTNVYEIDAIVIHLFTCKTFITNLLKARENILQQSSNGKRGYYMFSYPGLGWVQYDHNTIQDIYTLMEKKSKLFLYSVYKNENANKKARLHSVAALIIKCGDLFQNLYNGLEKSRQFTKDNRLVYVTFTNPFSGFMETDLDIKKYTGEEIMELYNIGLGRNSSMVFP